MDIESRSSSGGVRRPRHPAATALELGERQLRHQPKQLDRRLADLKCAQMTGSVVGDRDRDGAEPGVEPPGTVQAEQELREVERRRGDGPRFRRVDAVEHRLAEEERGAGVAEDDAVSS